MNLRTGKLTALDLQIANRDAHANCADSLPYPLETEPQHYGVSWRDPAPLRISEPGEFPGFNLRTLGVVVAVVAACAALSAVFPMGFAS